MTYQLFGSVYHHGTSLRAGHYTCDVRRQNGEWLHISDTTITPVLENEVLEIQKPDKEQTAYILFYIKA
jgi:ubiquitin carboxyl-terminal hydrolase 10